MSTSVIHNDTTDVSGVRFEINGDIVAEYNNKPLPFGFDGLGEFVYQRTYARTKPDGFTETWQETCLRVTNGTYTMQKQHILKYKLGWDEEQGQRSAREFYDRLYHLKFTPPGRGLWAMGTDIIYQRGLYAALNNCAFTTTGGIDVAPAIPFMFLMDMSMLGVGVGFDVAGAGKITVVCPTEVTTDRDSAISNITVSNIGDYADVFDTLRIIANNLGYLKTQITTAETKIATLEPGYVRNVAESDLLMYEREYTYVESLDPRHVNAIVIEDTREGWVESVGVIITSYLKGGNPVVFDYSKIRPEGVPIKGFGGKASGPEPLLDLHIMIRKILGVLSGKPITKTAIVDIMNLIGKAVVAGNVRRSSEIALGDPNDEEFMNLKNYEKNPQRSAWSWASNNSVYGKIGMDYTDIAQRIADNGEPGVFWLDNVRAYSRMGDAPDYKDHRVLGTNPCITADSIIDTSTGPRMVRDLIGVGFNAVFTTCGNIINAPSTEDGFYLTGTKDVYVLTLTSGHTLRLTKDHQVLTLSIDVDISPNFEYKWVAAGDLTVNDHVCINTPELKSQTSLFQSLDYDGTEDVYDCTIPQFHRFSANGIIVHNCGEQSLESTLDAGGEMCCLVETFPYRHESKEDFLRTLKFAYLYAKIVTLGNTHWVGTNRIQLRNRRIGTSVTGLTQFIAERGINALKDWLRSGYERIQDWDRIYSDWLAIPRSIKTTSIKPSGCMVPTTTVKAVIDGMHRDITLEDIFKLNGYQLSKFPTAKDLWLQPTKNIQVLDENNELSSITNLYINGKSNIYEFELSDGEVVRCTGEHKFKLTNGEWKRADELSVDDEIASFK